MELQSGGLLGEEFFSEIECKSQQRTGMASATASLSKGYFACKEKMACQKISPSR